MAESSRKLPFLVGIAHAGLTVPQPLVGRMVFDEETLRGHAEVGVDRVFEFPTVSRVRCGVHRYACDVDREPEAKGAQGAVPTQDLEGRPLYREGGSPTGSEVREMLDRHHALHHAGLAAAREDEDALYHLECGAMSPIPPATAPDRSRFNRSDRYRRPEVCLSNLGDVEGRPGPGRFATCPREDLIALARLFEREGFETLVNNPIAGGYTLGLYGKRWYAGLERVPVVGISIREDLWLRSPERVFDPERGEAVNRRLRAVLGQFADYLGQSEVAL